jgi:hypothetical protein
VGTLETLLEDFMAMEPANNSTKHAAHRCTTFKDILDRTEEQNVEFLKHRARMANRLAREAQSGKDRKALYSVKARAVDQLIRMGKALVDDLSLDGEPIVGIRFNSGGSLHVKFANLSGLAQAIVIEQIEAAAPARNVIYQRPSGQQFVRLA